MEEKIRKQVLAAEVAAASALAAEARKAAVSAMQKLDEYKVKATVAWIGDGGRTVGLQFAKIADSQLRQIEGFLKGLPS